MIRSTGSRTAQDHLVQRVGRSQRAERDEEEAEAGDTFHGGRDARWPAGFWRRFCHLQVVDLRGAGLGRIYHRRVDGRPPEEFAEFAGKRPWAPKTLDAEGGPGPGHRSALDAKVAQAAMRVSAATTFGMSGCAAASRTRFNQKWCSARITILLRLLPAAAVLSDSGGSCRSGRC